MSLSPTPSTAAETTYQASAGKQWFVNAYVGLIVAANLFVLWSAWKDKSWDALWLAFFGGPVANGVLFVVGLLILAFHHAMGWRIPVLGGLTIVFLPFFAVGIDLLIINAMGLSGC